MATPVSVDTAYFVALIDPRDTLNARAIGLAKRLAHRGALLVTSDCVLIELGNYFARSPLRVRAIEWIGALRSAEGWEVAPSERALVTAGEARYRAHPDKSWSVTDCISMELMADRAIRDIATTDRGFAQAGYRVLLDPTTP